MKPRHSAIFLDRDGTLIEDKGSLYDLHDIELFPDTLTSLRRLQTNHRLIVVTNQSGIAKGQISLQQVHRVNQRIASLLLSGGITIDGWYVCPHQRSDNCNCIKPKPTLLLEAAQTHQIDLKRSFMIGDHPHDALTAQDEGVFGLYLMTGHGPKHLYELPPDKLVFHRLEDAATWIEKHPHGQRDLDLQIAKGSRLISEGKVVAFPTETVYGLGADAFNPKAVERLFEIKKRPRHNPLIVHIADIASIDSLSPELPDAARALIDSFWPGPLTLVLKKREAVSDIVTAQNPSVAIRMPDNPIALSLIRQAQTPVAAPSANSFGCISPTTAEHVSHQLHDLVDMIIDGGACRIGVESTVISFTGKNPTLLRPGGISQEAIEAKIGPINRISQEPLTQLESPGLLSGHYAPKTTFRVFHQIPHDFIEAQDIGILLLSESRHHFAGPVEVLSRSGDLNEMAINLYAALRRLDSRGLRLIAAEWAPEKGIGRAINNRLEKASMGHSRR